MNTVLLEAQESLPTLTEPKPLTTYEKKKLYNKRRYQEKREAIRAQQDTYRCANTEQLRTSRLNNPQRKIQQRLAAKTYRTKHPEKARASVRASRAKHLEERQAFTRQARKAHPEYGQQAARKRRARKNAAPQNDFTHAQWVALQVACDHRCAYCGRRAKGRLTQDHIVPYANGGSHTLSNILPDCKPCNPKKGVKPPPLPVQPFLLL